MSCENWAGGAQCAAAATYRVRVLLEGMTVETELCGTCFELLNVELRRHGVEPELVASDVLKVVHSKGDGN